MQQETRGAHTCFVCGQSVNWAASLADGILMLHGSEVKATALVTGKDETTNDLKLQVNLKCPKCACMNGFKHQTPFLT